MQLLALLIVVLFVWPAGMQDEPQHVQRDVPPGIIAESLYCGVNRPLMVRVTPARTVGVTRLALMTASGELLAEPAQVRPGRMDLAEAFPMIWSIREAAYVQMLDHNEPVGSALVLQPMLSRMTPVTEPDVRPSGAPYSRIVGWRDENATEEDQAEPVERVFAGFRAYAEVDVILHTSHGEIRVAMRPDHAPNTVWNFLELSRGGFYRDVIFHRIVPLTATGDPFVIQAGDPSAGGSGGPGYWLPIEPSELPHDFGVISMARADHPDSAGSQFFFCLSREGTARLDGQYCSFGYAVSGAEVIVAISEAELSDVPRGKPAAPAPSIRRAELVPAPPRVPGEGRPDRRVSREEPPPPPRPTGRIPR